MYILNKTVFKSRLIILHISINTKPRNFKFWTYLYMKIGTLITVDIQSIDLFLIIYARYITVINCLYIILTYTSLIWAEIRMRIQI